MVYDLFRFSMMRRLNLSMLIGESMRSIRTWPVRNDKKTLLERSTAEGTE